MPFSHKLFDELSEKTISTINPKIILDIGVGAGKYGKILQKIGGIHSIAIEIEKRYVTEYKLDMIYDEVRIMNAVDLIETDIESKWDLVIIGDMIEHLKKSDGIDLLNFLLYRSKYIMVVFPDKYLQNEIHGNKYEAHISSWSKHDFVGFEHFYRELNNMRFVLINGFLNNSKEFNKIINLIN